jgi:hypothetical protein
MLKKVQKCIAVASTSGGLACVALPSHNPNPSRDILSFLFEFSFCFNSMGHNTET